MKLKRELRAIPQSSLHLADRQSVGNFSGTLDYIPGSALRGALAMTYLKRADLQQQVSQQLQAVGWTFQDYFRWLFLSDLVQFPNLYPQNQHPSFVIPLSAYSCKRYEGFIADGDHDHHGVVDVLLSKSEKLGKFRCAWRQKDHVCSSPMESIAGFYESADGSVSRAKRVKASRRLLTRTAMENATETVRHAQLYSLEAIEEGGGEVPIFTGSLNVNAPDNIPKPHQEILLKLFFAHLEDKFVEGKVIKGELSYLTLGAAKTRGLGTVQLEFAGVENPVLPPLEERFDKLQRAWPRAQPEQAEQTVFTITLNSDAIVMDKLWRYCSVLDEDTLAREIPSAPPCHLKKRFTDVRIVSGWNSAYRQPKEDELAIEKGAAFLYTTTADRTSLLAWLQGLEEQGIGERRNEGFGQVITCHPFHWEIPVP